MFAEIKSLVRGIDNDGVLGQAGFVEIIQQLPDTFIHGTDAAEVVLDVALVFPAGHVLITDFTGGQIIDEFLVFRAVCLIESGFLG